LNNVPLAGDLFEAVEDLDIARERANERAEVLRIERISAKAGEGKVTLSSIAASVSSGKQAGIDTHELNVILKVDYQVAKGLVHNLFLLFIFFIHFSNERISLYRVQLRQLDKLSKRYLKKMSR
jgi:hypothetical protein